jgi:hypothetical protein
VETVPCLLCGRADPGLVRSAPDRLAAALHAGPQDSFAVVRCRGCGLA